MPFDFTPTPRAPSTLLGQGAHPGAGLSSLPCPPLPGSQTRKPQVSDLFPVKHAPLRMGHLSPEVSLENQYCLDCLMGKSMLVIRKPG